jgi:hypothetical protein
VSKVNFNLFFEALAMAMSLSLALTKMDPSMLMETDPFGGIGRELFLFQAG